LLLIVKAFGKAIYVVLMIGVIVLILVYSLSIVCTQLIGHQADMFGESKDEVDELFGTIPGSMFTLFGIMFGSNWGKLQKSLTEAYPTGAVLIFVALYTVISISLVSLIVGLICEALLFVHEDFKERMQTNRAAKKKSVAAQFLETISTQLENDMDKDGAVDGGKIKKYFEKDAESLKTLIGVGVKLDIENLNSVIDSMTGPSRNEKITVEQFVEKITNLVGESQASAVVDLKYELVTNRNMLSSLEAQVDKLVEKCLKKK
jgi:hypothetical protein